MNMSQSLEGRSEANFYKTFHYANGTISVFAKHFSPAHLPFLNSDYNSDVTQSSKTIPFSSQKINVCVHTFIYIFISHTYFIMLV